MPITQPKHDTSPLTLNVHAFYHHPMHHAQHPVQPTTRQPGPTIPVPALLPCRRTRDPHPIPNSRSTPLERDKLFVAGLNTNMRQMRPISALQNPSPATALPPSGHPFATIFRRSPDTNLPRMRPRFPSWPRYNNETMRQIPATENSPQLRFWSHQLRTVPSRPVFTATKSPGMRPDFRSWLTYNHETNETTTPRNRDLRSLQNTPPKGVSKMSQCARIWPASTMSHSARIWPASKMSQMSHFSATKHYFSYNSCDIVTSRHPNLDITEFE